MSKARSNPASRARAEWTPELVRKVASRHADGVWLKHACALEGGTYDGLIDACAREPEYRAIIDEAHAQGAEKRRSRLELSDDWRREAWELERWDQAVFHLTNKVESKAELTGKDGGPLRVEAMTPAQAKARAEEIIAALPAEAREHALAMLKLTEGE